MIALFAAAAAPVLFDLSKLPALGAGAQIGYEMCLFGAAEQLWKADKPVADLFEVAKETCSKERIHVDALLDTLDASRHAEANTEITDEEFAESERTREALAERSRILFEAYVRNFRADGKS